MRDLDKIDEARLNTLDTRLVGEITRSGVVDAELRRDLGKLEREATASHERLRALERASEVRGLP
jgi:hypothetical protein